jgi:hypothetical protein
VPSGYCPSSYALLFFPWGGGGGCCCSRQHCPQAVQYTCRSVVYRSSHYLSIPILQELICVPCRCK